MNRDSFLLERQNQGLYFNSVVTVNEWQYIALFLFRGSIEKLFSNDLCQYLSFLNIFFKRICPVDKCGVTLQCLYRDSLTLRFSENKICWYHRFCTKNQWNPRKKIIMAGYSSICAGKQIFHRFRDFRGIALAFILLVLMIYMSTTVQKKKLN